MNTTALSVWWTANAQNFMDIGVALLILIVGWIVALALRWFTRRIGAALRLDERLATAVGDIGFSVERVLAMAVFAVTMLVVLVEFLRRLHLEGVSNSLAQLVDQIVAFLPRLGGALLLLLVAWIIATVVRALINTLALRTNLDARLAAGAELDTDDHTPSISSSVATAAYYLIFLLFLPAILSVLNLQGIAEPMTRMLDDLVGYLPNILAAALTFVVGYFAARIVRQIVTNLLAATGADRFGTRFGLSDGLRISNFVGTVVYALILIAVAIQALETLGIAAISDPARNILEDFAAAIPNVLAAAFILGLAWIFGRWIADLITTLLRSIGFDRVTERLGLRAEAIATPAGQQPSEIVGYVALVFILLIAAGEAARLVGFAGLAAIIDRLMVFGGRVILAAVVLGVGIFLANALRNIILGSGIGGPYTRTLARAAQVAVIILSTVIAVSEMQLGGDVVPLAFAGLIEGLGLGVALAIGLAVGLGGVDTARRWIEKRMSPGGEPRGETRGETRAQTAGPTGE